MGDFTNTNCIVLFGHNPRKHSWTPIFNAIKAARARGAKLIVLDPRVSDQAEDADLHLRLHAGTDAAMCLGWLKVIFDEGLYDNDFVDRWCAGFEALKARVDEYPLDRVEQITGVDRELIAQAARMYATADGAVIPLDAHNGYADLQHIGYPFALYFAGSNGQYRYRWRRNLWRI